MKHLLLSALLLAGFGGCGPGYDRGVREVTVQAKPVGCPRQEVFCYLTNFSFGDTLQVASAKLVVDDSLVVVEQVPRNSSGSERLSKVVRLCVGSHQVHVQFGPYKRDTTFVVRRDTAISLVVSMVCRAIPELTQEDGVGIVTLVRDGMGGPD